MARGDGEAAETSTGVGHGAEVTSVLVARVGHGGNCSSVGSVIDTLFVSAAVGGAILAAICAAMKDETVTVVGTNRPRVTEDDHETTSQDEDKR